MPPGIAPKWFAIWSLGGSESDPSLEGRLPAPSAVCHFEARSSKKAGIDGPSSRAEHRHTGSQHRQEDVNQAAVRW